MKNKIAVILSCIVGILFLFSGIVKCIDVFGFQQLIIQYGIVKLHWTAPFIVIAEIVAGEFLLLQIRNKAVVWCSFLMVVLFTVAFTYANYINGVVDCGCFGRFKFFSEYPTLVYVRNGFLLSALLFLALVAKSNELLRIDLWKKIVFFVVLFPSVFISGMTYRPFAFSVVEHELRGKALSETTLNKLIPKSKGKNWITFINPNCHHCWNSIENIKSYRGSKYFDKVDLFMTMEDTMKFDMDSIRIAFEENFGDIKFKVILNSVVPYVKTFPTSFYIENDTIVDVLEQEVPALLTLRKIYIYN